MRALSPYDLLLIVVLVLWPLAIVGLLYLMSKLEGYVNRLSARTPEEAGLEPVGGDPVEREIKIVVSGRPAERSDT